MDRQTRELLDELDRTTVVLLWGAILVFCGLPTLVAVIAATLEVALT
jgi:hypothetical protein